MKANTHASIAISAVALIVSGPPAMADQHEIQQLISPVSQAVIGVGVVDEDNQGFGIYTGMNEDGGYLLADVDWITRDDATGTWLRLGGSNLGLDNRDLRFEQQRQGDWGYFIDFSQFTRVNPYTVTTGLTGLGTNNQLVTGTAPRVVELTTDRDRLKLGFDRNLSKGLDLKLRFRHEEKQGDRPWGTQGFNFVTEPIDYVMNELEARLDYSSEHLQLAGGYLGSFFRNEHEVLNADVNISGSSQVSLPLDNEAHQLFLTGGYSFSANTRGMFKVSYTRNTQDETFFTAPTAPGNTRADLGGKVNTLLAYLGLSARPLPKLNVNASLRFEDRDDKTPVVQYSTSAPHFFNIPMSREYLTAKVEATYRLPMHYSLNGGIEFDSRERDVPESIPGQQARQVSWRKETDETSYRIALRKSMSETLNGSIGVIFSDRDGSPYLEADDNAAADVIDPVHWADRERQKLRLTLDWMASEAASVQFIFEDSEDEYDGRPLGPIKGEASFASLDASYTLSDEWRLNAWISHNETKIDQATNGDLSAPAVPVLVDEDWVGNLRHLGDAVGFGVRGDVSERIKLGADLQYSDDKSEHRLQQLSGAALTSLPDIFYKVTSLKLFVDYALKENSGLRFDYRYEKRRTDDWTWVNWVYADGTTVMQDPKEEVHFLGVSYYYRWW